MLTAMAVAAPAQALALDPRDELLIAELTKDGRGSLGALAAATGWHESTVRRRIEELRRTGARASRTRRCRRCTTTSHGGSSRFPGCAGLRPRH
jgi:predicted ArsR family transcriptional regulator